MVVFSHTNITTVLEIQGNSWVIEFVVIVFQSGGPLNLKLLTLKVQKGPLTVMLNFVHCYKIALLETPS